MRPPEPISPPEVHVRILGSGVLLPDAAHGSPAHWLEGAGLRILMDCGAGTLHALARERLAWSKISHIVLTHFHTDHTGDLPALLWALRYGVLGGRTDPLELLGPVGLRARLSALAEAHGAWLLNPGFPLGITELAPHDAVALVPQNTAEEGGRLETHPANHTPEALAIRVAMLGVKVGYTGDTGPSDELGVFFRGMDLLIAECAQADPLPSNPVHLSPKTLARLVQAAAPGIVVPVHLYPEVPRDTLAERLRVEGVRAQIAVGEDGLGFDLPAKV